MSAPDPELVAAIEAAVVADPDNLALRVHLAGLLSDDGRPEAALDHLEIVLGRRPDHVAALGEAARAARATGATERADAWQRLHDALDPAASAPRDDGDGDGDGDGGPPATVTVGAGDREPTGDESEHDWDAMLRDLVDDAELPSRVTLADVGGLDDVKRRLETAFLAPMRNPELREMYKTSLRGGLLLWGPPGCGKTFVARAVAGELGAYFISVGLHDVLDMYLGVTEQNLHGIFEAARRRAPCVLFFDELDALGHKRADLARSAGRNAVVQLLAELDGVGDENEGVFVLGATNLPWDVDPALRRPGRFDRTILVLPPDAAARAEILRFHLRDRPIGTVSVPDLVGATEGFSGADLRAVCEGAAQRALEASVASGTARPIDQADLVATVAEMQPSPTAWLDTARSYAEFANQSGEYDELATYLRQKRRR